MIKTLGWLLFFALILRLVISGITYHSDIQTYDLAAYVYTQGNLLNFYDYFPNLETAHPVTNNFPSFNFNYPPAVYFVISLVATTFNFLFTSTFLFNFLVNPRELFGTFELYLHLLLLKLPLLFMELATIWLLYKLFGAQKEAKTALIFWLFNPAVLFAIFMVGQFDIVSVFFTVLSLFFLRKYQYDKDNKGLTLAALSLGVGAAFKIYPLFLLVPLVSLSDSWITRAKLAALGVIPYILTILPFLPSEGFRSSALLSGQALKSFYAQIPISGGESIILFVAILSFFYLLFLFSKTSINNLWQRYLITFLVFFIFTHYHPQWLLWAMPFLVLELGKNNLKNIFAFSLIITTWLISLFFFDTGLNVGLFAPLFPGLFNTKGILEGFLDYNFSRSILQSIFVAASLFYIYIYFPKKEDL